MAAGGGNWVKAAGRATPASLSVFVPRNVSGRWEVMKARGALQNQLNGERPGAFASLYRDQLRSAIRRAREGALGAPASGYGAMTG